MFLKGSGENGKELYLMCRKGDKYGRRREKGKMTVRMAEKVVRSHAVHLPKNTYSIYKSYLAMITMTDKTR